MDEAVAAVIEAFHERSRREAELMKTLSSETFDARIDEFMLPVGPDAGRLLNLLIRGQGARCIVEVGSSYGYSTVWMAEAARATGGTLVSLEKHEGKQAAARRAVSEAGLAEQVEFVPGDAEAALAAITGPVDFVLLDLWKRLYIPCFERVYPKLAAGALVAADNMTQPAGARERARQYQAHVRTKADIDSVLLPVGSGIELSRRRAGDVC